jgi:hypothetical protein
MFYYHVTVDMTHYYIPSYATVEVTHYYIPSHVTVDMTHYYIPSHATVEVTQHSKLAMKCIGSANRNSVDVTGHFSDEIVMNLTILKPGQSINTIVASLGRGCILRLTKIMR